MGKSDKDKGKRKVVLTERQRLDKEQLEADRKANFEEFDPDDGECVSAVGV
jgi:hypothetical protein